MAINMALYPDDILSNPGKPYIYFNSLSNEILDKVAEYFNKDITSFSDADTGETCIN